MQHITRSLKSAIYINTCLLNHDSWPWSDTRPGIRFLWVCQPGHSKLLCYYELPQLRVVMRSLSHDATVVLVHAFVTSRIDHCCPVLVGPSLGLIGHLDQVLLPTLLVTLLNIPLFLPTCMMSSTGFFIFPCTAYRITALVWQFLTGCAPSYLSDLCMPVSELASRNNEASN